MKELYICDTPYQVMNALNIAFHSQSGSERTIFIINQFRTAEELHRNVKDSQLFNHVYLLHRDEATLMPVGTKRYFRAMWDYLTPRLFIRARMCGERVSLIGYDTVYASVASRTVSAILKLNPKAEFILFDDGTGSYSDNILMRSGSKWNLLFCKVFQVGAYACHPTKLLVYNVEMCRSTSVPKERIFPLPSLDKEFITICNNIFDNRNDFKNHIYWISQPIDGVPGAVEARDEVMNSLFPYREKVTVRLHPRDLECDYYDGFTVDYGRDMWELAIQGMDIDNVILISGYSSALVNPKLLFDMEPTLVFVYQFNRKIEVSKKRDIGRRIEEIKSIYRDSSKIYTPKTNAELSDIINDLIIKDVSKND